MEYYVELSRKGIPDNVLESLEWERVIPGALIGFHIIDVIHHSAITGELIFLIGYYVADKSQEPVFFQIFPDDETGWVRFERSLPLNKNQKRAAIEDGLCY